MKNSDFKSEIPKKLIIGGLLIGFLIAIPKFLFRKRVLPQPPVNRKHKNIKYDKSEWLNQKIKDYNPEEKIFIPNEHELRRKLQKLRKGGLDNVQIATDFDQTITAFFAENGESVSPTFGSFRKSGLVSQNMIM